MYGLLLSAKGPAPAYITHVVANTERYDLAALTNHIAPHDSWAIIVALINLIANTGLMPQEGPAIHLRILLNWSVLL